MTVDQLLLALISTTLNDGTFERFQTSTFQRFSPKMAAPFGILMALYASWVTFALGGPRPDHLLMIFGLSFLYFATDTSRKVVMAFGFILVYWFIWDSIRLFPNYILNPPLHIAEPYFAEKAWFGISTAEGILTPNEYWGRHTYTFLDIYTAIVYLGWVPVPLAFCFYLFFTRQRTIMVKYLFTFLMVSQLALSMQFLYPAAPPWYVELYPQFLETFPTLEQIQSTRGNAGRLIEFDKFFGTNLFAGMYDINANVFAAIPSLHCAYPIVLVFFSFTYKMRGWLTFGLIMMVSTWFSAVYTNHHYIIDVILGVGVSTFAVLIYSLLMKTRVKDWLDLYGKNVS